MASIPKLEKEQRIEKLLGQTTQPNFGNMQPLNPNTNTDKEARITALMNTNMGAVSPIIPKVKTNTEGQRTIKINGQDIPIADNVQIGGTSIGKAPSNLQAITDDNYKQVLSKEDAIKRQQNQARLTREGAYGVEHPVLATATSLATTPMVGVEGIINNAIGLATGNKDNIGNKALGTRELLREGAKSNLKNGQGVYDVAMGIGDMLVNTAATGGNTALAGTLMGGNRANQVQKEAIERGLDTRRASALGAVAGGAEGYFNTLGLDKLKEGAGILKGAGIEGLENIAQSGVEDIADAVISGKNSEINSIKQSYINQGMSEEEANRRTVGDVAKQYGMEFGTGAAFGALLGAGKNVSGKLRSHIVNQNGNGRSMSDIIESLADEDVADDIADNVADNADKARVVADAITKQNEVVDNINRLNEQLPEQANTSNLVQDSSFVEVNKPFESRGNYYVGRGTKLKGKPYTGTDIPIQTKQNTSRHTISGDTINSATARYNEASSIDNGKFTTNLKKIYEAIFDKLPEKRMELPVENMNFNGKPYNVTVHKNAVSKLLNSKVNVDKMAILEELPEIIKTSNYVGSGEYTNPNKPNSKSTRYDYLEKPISLKGKDYIVTFSIEIEKDVNKYRTHAILDEIKIQQLAEQLGVKSEPTSDAAESFIDSTIPQSADVVNTSEKSNNRLNSPDTDVETNAGKNIPLNNESVLNDTNNPVVDNAVNNAEPNKNIAQNADDGSATLTFDMPKAENTDIPKAENAPRDINQRPFVNENTNSPDMAERRTITNTAKNNSLLDNLTENEIKQLKEYERIHESTSLSDAEERVKDTNSRLRWENDFVNGNRKFQSSTDTDTGMLLLTDIEKKIRNTDEADVEAINNLTARKQKLLSNMAEQMTEKGQAVQALAKWNRTSDGAILNGEIIAEKEVKKWVNKGKNTKDVDFNKKIAGALSMLNPKNTAEETAEQAENTIEGIKNALDRGGVLKNFNEDAINQLKGLIDSGVSGEELADEIQHYIRHGEFYTIGEEIPFKEPTNKKLKNAIDNMFDTGIVKQSTKEPISFNELRESVKNTIDSEFSASISKQFDDIDIDYLTGMIQNGATTKELTDLLNRKAVIGNFGISNQTQKEVAEIFDSISHLDPNSKDYVEMATEAYRKIAFESLPNATFGEKFDAWRYLAMLGNPKTITRNVLGNKMNAVTTGFSNNLAAAMEMGADKLSKNGIERTKAFINPIADKPMLDLAKQDADNFRYADLSGSRFSKRSVKDDIIANRQIWKKGGIVDKWQNATDRFLTDYPAAKNKYATSLVGYMKANNLDNDAYMKEALYKNLNAESKIRVLSPEERLQMNEYKSVADLMEKARDYATKEAKYATFHEDSVIADKISRTISDWKNTEAGGTQGFLVRTAGLIAEGNIPFVSTPINITKVGIQYSPLNAISSISKTGKMILKKGVEPSEVISSWSKTLTGSMMFLMGKYLYDRGVLLSSDNETAWQDTLEGKQNYSIKFTKPNGSEATYTVDWLAPGIMPMILGTEYAKMMTDKGEDDTTFIESIKNKDFENAIETAANSALNIASPIMENSMLNGLNDTLKTAANAAQNKEQAGAMLMQAGLNSIISYGTQGVPTIAGQFARTIDNTRRSTYTEKQGIAGVLDKQLQKQENKLPFLSMFNNPYVDTYGRQQNNGIVNTDNPLVNFLPNLAYQMFSPGYFQNIKQTDVDKEARRLYDDNNDPAVFPNTGTQAKVGGKKMDKDTSYLYNTTAGTALSEMGDTLVNSDFFKNLSDEDKAEALQEMYKTARAIGNVKVGADTKPSDAQKKLVDIYNTRGATGYVNRLAANAVEKANKEKKTAENKMYKSYGVENNEKTEAVMADKGEAGLQFIGDMRKAIKDENGRVGAVKAYEYLSSQNLSDYDKGYYIVQTASSIPKLVKQMADKNDYASVNEYYYIKDTFDTNGNGKLNKSEKDAMIPELKRMGYSDSDIDRMTGYFK